MADSSSDVLRDQIRATLKASGLKQIWIAQQLGISQKHLSQMLTGRVALTLDWAQRIAGLCGYRVTVVVEPVADVERERMRADAAEAALRDVLGVAEVIEANGIRWAADSVRHAVNGSPRP